MLSLHLPYDPVIPLLGIYPPEIKDMPSKRLYKNVYSSFAHNFPKLETTHMSIHNEVYSVVKKNKHQQYG